MHAEPQQGLRAFCQLSVGTAAQLASVSVFWLVLLKRTFAGHHHQSDDWRTSSPRQLLDIIDTADDWRTATPS